MGFQKMTATLYPPRHWGIYGEPGAGKSTFIHTLRQPMLVVDADQRFKEILRQFPDLVVYQLSPVAADNTDPDRIAALLNENMRGSDTKTIVFDSATAIITPMVTQAIVDKKHGREKNMMSGFNDKAMGVRQLQDAATKWGTDVIYIWHVYEARDANAQAVVRASLPETERLRLMRSLNLHVEIVRERGRYAAKVAWARRGRSGMTLLDEAGDWKGMPERIEEAVYGGLSEDEQDRIEREPESFASPEAAIAWAMSVGAFDAAEHARNAYGKAKEKGKPATAKAMRDLWVADVQRRVAEKSQRSLL